MILHPDKSGQAVRDSNIQPCTQHPTTPYHHHATPYGLDYKGLVLFFYSNPYRVVFSFVRFVLLEYSNPYRVVSLIHK